MRKRLLSYLVLVLIEKVNLVLSVLFPKQPLIQIPLVEVLTKASLLTKF